MKRSTFVFVISLCLFLSAGVSAWQQQNQTTDVGVQGHFYEPAKLEPIDARIAGLKLPAGFSIQKFAELSNPRMIAVAEDGTVYITQREPGTLIMLRDTDKDGVADVQKVVAEKKMLHGITIYKNRVYLATVKEVFVADRKPDGTLGELQTLINDLPDGGQHPNRTLAVGADNMLYITVGSTCNNCKETDERSATIVRAKLDGKEQKVYASGLRNTIGFGWHPTSKRMFGMDHGIDWLGDDDQQEELNELVEGGIYGWPFVYANDKIYPHGEVPKGYTKEVWVKMSKEPALLYTPHSAPMQMTFYTGNQFPAEYKNDAFVAMRGSWNRVPPSGYEVVCVRFDKQGNPKSIEPFLTGFLAKGEAPGGKDGQFARLAGIAVTPDGSLLVGDDSNGVIYKISYTAAGQPQRVSFTTATQTNAVPRMITYVLPEMSSVTGSIKVTSDTFKPNGAIPQANSSYGEDRSPVLKWSGVPQNAKSLVLMMEDPDAFNPKPVVHWLMANIPPAVTQLPASLPKGETLAQINGALQGANIMSTLGYYGPKPPAGDPPHHYHFQIFALDTLLNLPSGFNRQTLLKAIHGHVLAKGEVIGTFQK